MSFKHLHHHQCILHRSFPKKVVFIKWVVFCREECTKGWSLLSRWSFSERSAPGVVFLREVCHMGGCYKVGGLLSRDASGSLEKSGKLQAHTGFTTVRGGVSLRGGVSPPLSPKILANFTTKLHHFLIPGTNFLKYKVM